MTEDKGIEQVRELITQAVCAKDHIQAMQYSQAALNCANALNVLTDVERKAKPLTANK